MKKSISVGQTEKKRTCPGMIHVVKEGDTLYEIARMHHVPLQELMYENPYVNVYNLKPGDEICVPVGRRPADTQRDWWK